MTQIMLETFNMPAVYFAIQTTPLLLVSDRATCPETDSLLCTDVHACEARLSDSRHALNALLSQCMLKADRFRGSSVHTLFPVDIESDCDLV